MNPWKRLAITAFHDNWNAHCMEQQLYVVNLPPNSLIQHLLVLVLEKTDCCVSFLFPQHSWFYITPSYFPLSHFKLIYRGVATVTDLSTLTLPQECMPCISALDNLEGCKSQIYHMLRNYFSDTRISTESWDGWQECSLTTAVPAQSRAAPWSLRAPRDSLCHARKEVVISTSWEKQQNVCEYPFK